MSYSLREVQYETLSGLIERSHGQESDYPYEQLLKETEVSLIAGCSRLGIPFSAQFGGVLEPPVPDVLADQIRGQHYRPAMTVEIDGETHAIVFLSIFPGKDFPRELFDPEYDSVERFKIEPGRMIPRDSDITMLKLVPAHWISAN